MGAGARTTPQEGFFALDPSLSWVGGVRSDKYVESVCLSVAVAGAGAVVVRVAQLLVC